MEYIKPAITADTKTFTESQLPEFFQKVDRTMDKANGGTLRETDKTR